MQGAIDEITPVIKVVGGTPSGAISSLASGTTLTQIGTFTLETGTYIINLFVQWGANATGRRSINLSTSSGGSAVHYMWQDIQNAVNGTNTINKIGLVLRTTETTTYYINGYQNSGSSLKLICRYQALKLK